MSRNAKILIDLAVLAAVYGIWLLPKWRPLGRRTLAVYTLMYGCLAGIVRFTLMPVLTALPAGPRPEARAGAPPARAAVSASADAAARRRLMRAAFAYLLF